MFYLLFTVVISSVSALAQYGEPPSPPPPSTTIFPFIPPAPTYQSFTQFPTSSISNTPQSEAPEFATISPSPSPASGPPLNKPPVLQPLRPFTVKSFQDGYREPGNLTDFIVVAYKGRLVLQSPNSTLPGDGPAPEPAVLYVDQMTSHAFIFSPWKQNVFLDSMGTLRYLRPEAEVLPSDAIMGPFFYIGKNPKGLTYTAELEGYNDPAPAVFAAMPWNGLGFLACEASKDMYTLHVHLAYWMEQKFFMRCSWVWLAAIDFNQTLSDNRN